MHRKFYLLPLSIALTLALLSCSGGESQSTPAAADRLPADTPVTLASVEKTESEPLPNHHEHPLDKEFQQCTDENPANLGVRECLSTFLEKWDAELNRLYKELRNTPAEKQKAALKSSQLAWIAFRDKEFAYIEAQLGWMEGSMYPNMILRRKMNVVRARVLELYDYREFQKTME